MTPPIPKKVWVGVGIVVAFGLIAVFASVLAPYDPNLPVPTERLASPSWTHLLGTDDSGRDTFSRLLFAARVDLRIAVLGALLPALVGSALGAIAGYFGGLADTVVMRTADLIQAFPIYIFIVALVFALGPGEGSILIAFTVIAWVVYARLVRSEVLRLRNLDFIQAARGGGLSQWRILTRHVVPNASGQVITYLPSDMVVAMLTLATFSFFSLGVPPPTAEWGSMIADGTPFLRDNWWLSTAPGLMIAAAGIGFSLVGDGFDERLSRR